MLSPLQAEAHSVRRLSIATKDITYDSVTQKIYASVPSSAGGIGNSITQINPFTGGIGPSVFIGSEPGKLAISDNGQYLYAYLEGAVAVRRFDVTTQTSGLQFNLRTAPSADPYSAFDIAVMPGRPESVAVSGGSTLAVYDDDVRRPTAFSSFSNPFIDFSASADTLYSVVVEGGSSRFQKFSVTASGVTLSSTTQVTGGGNFRFSNGRVYMPTGQVIDASSGALLGTFPDVGSALVVPDPAAGRVYFLTNGTSYGSTWTIKAYDMNTFVLLGSLPIPDVTGTPTSLIRWGANGFAFRTGTSDFPYGTRNEVFLVQTSLIPSSEPIPSPTPTPSPTPSPSPSPAPAAGIRQVPLPSNDIIFDPSRQTIYASVPSVAGGIGNSVTIVDPATGAIGASVFVGSEPNKLALTDDNRFLYVALGGAAAVRRFDLTTQTAGSQFALGGDDFDGPFYARDLATLPGQPESVAVSRYGLSYSPDFEGVAIYDNGVQRPTTTPGHTGSDYIESSPSASTLYGSGYNAGIQKLSIDANGVTVARATSAAGYGGDMRFDNGLIFTTNGKVIEPESGTLKGIFSGIAYSSSYSIVAPDSANGRVFFLTSDSNGIVRLLAYDLNTFLPIGSLLVPNVVGTPSSLVRWGTNGLAFRTSGGDRYGSGATTGSGQIVLVQTSLVNPNEPVATPTASPTPSPTPSPPSVEVRQISLATNDIVYDASRNTIYASVPGSAGSNGNSIMPLDPAAGTLGASVFIGSEPKKLALSDNGQYLYAALEGAGAVRRFDLTTQTPGLQFSLGSDSGGVLKASDIAVLPGSPGSVAVLKSSSFSNRSVAVYDDAVQRPTVGSSIFSASYIEFSTIADTLYSYETRNSTTNLHKIAITPQGATIASVTPAGGTGDFRIANGRVYMPSGHVIDTATGQLVGRFSGASYNSLVAPDPANGRVYFLTGSDSYGSGPVTLTLRAYDINTFLPVGAVQIPGVFAPPSSLLRWGANGLAFRIGIYSSITGSVMGNRVFLIRTSLVPSSEEVPPERNNLVWQHQTSGLVGEWLMDGTTMIRAPLFTPDQVTDTNWKIVGTGDFNIDGQGDLVWQHQSTGQIGLWYMDGTRQTRWEYFTPGRVSDTNWKIVGVADFNIDQKPDLVWQHQTSGQIGVWYMNGATQSNWFYLNPSQVTDTNWKIVGVADFNNDQRPDLVWQHQANGQIGVWLMSYSSRTEVRFFNPNQVADTNWKIVGVADFNSDNKPDLVWQHQTSGQIGVWLLDGTSMIQSQYFTPGQVSDTNWKIVGVR